MNIRTNFLACKSYSDTSAHVLLGSKTLPSIPLTSSGTKKPKFLSFLISTLESSPDNAASNNLRVFLIDILGFSVDINNDKKIGNSDELISAMIEIRDFSRKNKNHEISDFIRNKLNSFGINLNDN